MFLNIKKCRDNLLKNNFVTHNKITDLCKSDLPIYIFQTFAFLEKTLLAKTRKRLFIVGKYDFIESYVW